jgi:hypothetical protein
VYEERPTEESRTPMVILPLSLIFLRVPAVLGDDGQREGGEGDGSSKGGATNHGGLLELPIGLGSITALGGCV